MTWTATDRAAYSRSFARTTFTLGLAIERAGRTWTTWEVDLDDEPADRMTPPERTPTR